MSRVVEADARPVDPMRLREVRNAFDYGERIYLEQGSPVWSAIAGGVANDPELVEVAARGGQPHHMFLILAAAYLASKAADGAKLAEYLPLDSRSPAAAAEVFPHYREFVLSHRDEMLEIITKRTVQSTALERASYVLPLLDYVADIAGEPLNLIEIGCSAGLLTVFDCYGYDFGEFGRLGDPKAAVVAPGKMIGAKARAPRRIPTIGTRIGLDLSPVDAASPDERRWLLAQISPAWPVSRGRLAAALEVAATSNLRTVKGDATDLMPGLLAEVDSPLCVMHSAVLYYFSDEAREKLDRQLRDASRGRIIHRIGVEQPEDYVKWARIAAEKGETVSKPRPPFSAIHTIYEDGDARRQELAHCDQYGLWMEWLV